jgi:DNA-binding NarL/FixJ family response regulator
VHKPISTLTQREHQIVALVVEGKSNREIATRLGLSAQTVKNQLSVILDKVGLTSRVQLAVYAVRHHLDRGQEEK